MKPGATGIIENVDEFYVVKASDELASKKVK
jgi:hypothetical protein